MSTTSWKVWGTVLLGTLAVARPALGEVTGSFDGSLASARLAGPLAVAAVLSQTGRTVTGTVALPGDPSAFGGAYLVNGRATPKSLKVSGTAGLVRFKWRARITGDTLQGKARVKRPGQVVAGTLALTRNVSAADGSACDGVLQANETYFVDQVLGQALAACDSCHAPGLQAGATRLHVNAADPLATARSVSIMVDPANPSGSRLLQKPLALLPHGGGLQLMVGSTQEQILMQWIAFLVQAQCS
jgi:hypothetical protein